MADEELMARAGAGEQPAFEVIFDRHSQVAYSLAYRICGRRASAEEIAQDAFLAVWRGAARYEQRRGSVRTFVLAIVRNKAIDALRSSAAKESLDMPGDGVVELIQARERTEQEVSRHEDARAVARALEELPDDQRRVIELAFFGGLSHSEIARLLELAPGTVKGRMRLGMAKLRAKLGDPVAGVL
ncbi:MAG: RNA polymerase sigma factor [Solirubrobacteraceae bacterium]